MKYNKIVKAKFIERPNRFVAYCDINGKVEKRFNEYQIILNKVKKLN